MKLDETDDEDEKEVDGGKRNVHAVDIESDTSEEERELPGQIRPPRGSGWWGVGRALQPHRKGLRKEFVDGAGLASPGH